MKFLCLAFGDEKKFEEMSSGELEEISGKCQALDEVLRKSGHMVAMGALGLTPDAATVRTRKGKVSVTDGPFAETKEQVGGFFIVEARDLKEAIRVVEQTAPARLGEHLGWGVEIRPIEFFEAG
ncbi:MAG TPA: YciI family protein [Candidatus Binataceae bacterium]|nr:YciI family protein [Candidatus Binataceae bacterium]